MSAWKPKHGTREIDRFFPGIGRVRLRTGTKDHRRAQQYETMLELLPLDVVRLIAKKRIPLRVAYDAWVAGRVNELPTAQTLLPLADEFAYWLEKPALPVGESEAASRQRTAEYLLGLRPDAPVGDVAKILAELRGVMEDRGAAFNRSHAVVLAFVRDRFGDQPTLRDQVAAVLPLPEPELGDRHPCTVDEARAIAAALGPKWGPCWWTMCITGMGPKEYWINGFTVTTDGVEVHGTKDTTRRGTTARARVVPLLGVLAPPIGTPSGFTQALERAQLGVEPYDARRSFARWLDDAGLAGYIQDALMGHGPKSMRELYKWGEIRGMLGEAKEKMLKQLQAVPQITRSSATGGA